MPSPSESEPTKNSWNPKLSPLMATALVVAALFLAYNAITGAKKGFNHQVDWDELKDEIIPKVQARLPKKIDDSTIWVEIKPTSNKELLYRLVIADAITKEAKPEQLDYLRARIELFRERIAKQSDPFSKLLIRTHSKIRMRYEDSAGNLVCEFIVDPEKTATTLPAR